MAWTLQFLIWITAMAVSAQNYRGYVNPYYQYSEGIVRPSSRLRSIDNTQETSRGTDYSTSLDRQVRIQTRITDRSENGPKSVHSRVQVSEKGGEASLSDRIVFPGPTAASSSGNFEPDVTPECKKLGYCPNVPNYPKEHVKTIINEFSDVTQWFQMDTIDISVQIAQRLGGIDQTLYPLCNFTEQIIFPFSAPDKNNEWFQVINDAANPVQGFLAEMCVPESNACSEIAMIQPNYNASCIQKYVYRKVAVINKADGKPVQKSLQLPSCCSCVAQSRDSL